MAIRTGIAVRQVSTLMTRQVRKIGGWSVLGTAFVSALLIGAPSDEECFTSSKRDFTSPLRQNHVWRRSAASHLILRSIGYGDHKNEIPAFEQLTLSLFTPAGEDNAVACARVDEMASDQLRIIIGSAAQKVTTRSNFAERLDEIRKKLPAGSIYQSIEQGESRGVLSFLIRLSRPAQYRFNASVTSGTVLICLYVRSYKAAWIAMDPAIIKDIFGARGAIAHIEYRPPSGVSDHDSVDVPVHIRQTSGLETTVNVVVPNVAVKFQNESYLAELIRQKLPALLQPPAPQPPSPPAAPEIRTGVASFELNALQNQAEAVRRRSGAGAREGYLCERLEAFARLPASRQSKSAYEAMEQSYATANVSPDDRYLFRVFANFASAKLADLDEDSLQPELPRAGAWASADWGGSPRPPAGPLVEPVFDEPLWSWRQGVAAVAYNVGSCRAALHVRGLKEVFSSDSVQRFYGSRLVLEVAGSYTTPDGNIAALAARDGVFVGFLPRSWEGLVIIRDGHVRVVSVLELTEEMLGGAKHKALHIFSSPEDFVEFLDLVRKNKVSLIQGHLLTLRGKYDGSANDKLRARRRVLMTGTGNDSSVGVIDFAEGRDMTLRQCARWLSGFDKEGTAVNLDTGAWDFGRFYGLGDGKPRNLGVQAVSDDRLSNKFVFSRNVPETR
jgi:hypothetical protein